MTPFPPLPPLTLRVYFGACCLVSACWFEKSAKILANVMINSFTIHSLLDSVDTPTVDCHCDSAFAKRDAQRCKTFP